MINRPTTPNFRVFVISQPTKPRSYRDSGFLDVCNRNGIHRKCRCGVRFEVLLNSVEIQLSTARASIFRFSRIEIFLPFKLSSQCPSRHPRSGKHHPKWPSNHQLREKGSSSVSRHASKICRILSLSSLIPMKNQVLTSTSQRYQPVFTELNLLFVRSSIGLSLQRSQNPRGLDCHRRTRLLEAAHQIMRASHPNEIFASAEFHQSRGVQVLLALGLFLQVCNLLLFSSLACCGSTDVASSTSIRASSFSGTSSSRSKSHSQEQSTFIQSSYKSEWGGMVAVLGKRRRRHRILQHDESSWLCRERL